MARGRMLNTTIAADIKLNELSLEAHFAYMMAIPHLDKDGLMRGHPKIVGGQICPLRDDIREKMAAIIQEWISAGLVISYPSDSGPVLYFTGFQKNQSLGAGYIKEGKSLFPPPPGYIRTNTGLIPEELGENTADSGATPDLLPTKSGQTPLARVEVEDQVEVKDQDQGREIACARNSEPSPLPPALVIFQEFCTKPINQTKSQAIVSTVTDLDLWRHVLTEWNLRPYSPDNVNGLLDWYRDGIPPVNRNGNHGAPSKRSESSNGDDTPKLDPAIQRQFDERRKRTQSQSP